MPDAYKCSKGGGLYEGEPYESFEMDDLEDRVELCKSCSHEIISFLEEHTMTQLEDYEDEYEQEGIEG